MFDFVTRAIIGGLLSMSICVTSVAQQSQVPFRVTKLIGDLNDSVKLNKEAREQLVEMGEVAIPGLLQEIKKYSKGTDVAELSAARCLRVLSAIGSDEASLLASEMLATIIPNKKLADVSKALLSESMMYLITTANDDTDLTAVFRFMRDETRWFSSRYYYEHYPMRRYKGRQYIVGNSNGSISSYRSIDRTHDGYTKHEWVEDRGASVRIDIFTPLSILIENNNTDARNIVRDIFPELPYICVLNYCYLSNDGFTARYQVYVPRQMNSRLQAGSGEVEWLDPKARVRIICMRWFLAMKDVDSVKLIEPMLRSKHQDERDYALLVLEELTEH